MVKKIFLLIVSVSLMFADAKTEETQMDEYSDFDEIYVEESRFNIGIGVGVLLLDEPDIIDTTVNNGKVVITDEEKEKLGFWLTSSWVNSNWPSKNIQIGPFIGLQLFDEKSFLNSLAVGINLSFMKVKYGLPLDFQLGWAWTRTSELAKGYKENEALPDGVSSIITKDVISDGFIFITSYKF